MRALLAVAVCALAGVAAGAAPAAVPGPEAVVSLIGKCPRKQGVEIVPLVGMRCEALGRIDLPGGQVVSARMTWGRVAPLRLAGTLRLAASDGGTLVVRVTSTYFQLDIGAFAGVGAWRAVGGDRGPLRGKARWLGGPDTELRGPILRVNMTLRLTRLVAV